MTAAAQEGYTVVPASTIFGDYLTAYAQGEECLWHGPARSALYATRDTGDGRTGSWVCPFCSGPLRLRSAERFWADARQADTSILDLEAMLRWSAGRCFPDYVTLEEAWRQAGTE